MLEGSFFDQPSHIRDLGIRKYCIVVCKYLLDGRLLIFDVDRTSGNAMGNDPVGWYDEFCIFSKAFKPFLIFLELCSFSSGTGKYLYISAFKLMGSNYFDCTGGCIVLY
jgi:hypothetical protein